MAATTEQPLAPEVSPVLPDGTSLAALVDLERREVPCASYRTPEIYQLEVERCLGAQPGRLEARIAINVLADRSLDLRLLHRDDGYDPHDFLPRRERLPVAWTVPATDGDVARQAQIEPG